MSTLARLTCNADSSELADYQTALMFVFEALGVPCGEESVEWATIMLELGREGYHLAMLAGKTPPYNHFEMSAMRDRALAELGLPTPDGPAAITNYARELLTLALAEKIDIAEAISILARVYAKSESAPLRDFWLLDIARTDVEAGQVQRYWEGANAGNIRAIMKARGRAFLHEKG